MPRAFAADGHRRGPAWHDGLAVLLDHFDNGPMPPQVQAVVAQLRARDAIAIENLADEFLHGNVEAADAGPVLSVSVGPGWTLLTVIPRGARSIAMPRTSEATAPFVIE